jgi:hypothetical protein
MLVYLRKKKEALEAQRIEPCVVYEDLERKIDEYRSQLYAERDAEVTETNKLIDAKVSVLDEVIAETERVIEEAEAEAVEATYGSTEEETEQKESEI